VIHLAVSADPRQSLAGVLRAALVGLVVLSSGVLAWVGAHWLSFRLTDPHQALHSHGLSHGHDVTATDALASVHGYLIPAAGISLLALLLGLAALRLLPRPVRSGRTWARTGTGMVASALTSSALFTAVETAEHAVATHSLPPAALLAVGLVVHGALGAGAALLSGTAVEAICPTALPTAVRMPVLPVRRRVWSRQPPVRSALWLHAAAGRAPPLRVTPLSV
jgi:hypothetical protein